MAQVAQVAVEYPWPLSRKLPRRRSTGPRMSSKRRRKPAGRRHIAPHSPSLAAAAARRQPLEPNCRQDIQTASRGTARGWKLTSPAAGPAGRADPGAVRRARSGRSRVCLRPTLRPSETSPAIGPEHRRRACRPGSSSREGNGSPRRQAHGGDDHAVQHGGAVAPRATPSERSRCGPRTGGDGG